MNEIMSICIKIIGNIIAFILPSMMVIGSIILIVLKSKGKTFGNKNKNSDTKNKRL